MIFFYCRAEDMELGWLQWLTEQDERYWAEQERDLDLEQERQLAAAYLEDGPLDDVPDWPWYAEEQWEIQRRQVFGP